jgi:hypothetical protein
LDARMSAEVDASTHADHAHVDGKCTSWVDEALDAAGPEYADAPRPGSCCEKDAKAAAEAARVRRIVSAADPVRKAEALRRSSDPRFATRDAATLGAQELVDEAASSDLDSDDLLTDSDGEDPASTRFARTTDPHLLEIQEKRIREMKLAAARAAERAAAASYVSARETELPKLLADGPSRVCVFFPLDGDDGSARVDETLDTLAQGFPRTRFVRCRPPTDGGGVGNSRKIGSPTLAAIGAELLPAILCFRSGKLARWTEGFDDFGGVEGFDETRVVRWLARDANMLPGHPDAPETKGARVDDSDDEATASRRKARGGSDDDVSEDDETVCGIVGEPCAQCGRRYPHEHVRALRYGGGGFRGAESDEGSDEE